MWSKACGKRFKKTKRKTRKMNCRAGQDTNHKLLENKHYYYTSSVYILWQPTARAGSHNLSDLFALSRVSSHLTDMSHHITLYRGRICSPSVYPRRCRCVFCAKSDGEDWKPQGWQTLAYAQFRLHCQQFFHFWLFPHANFSTSYCFSTILSVFSALRVSPAPRRHDKWCQRSCIVFRKGKQELGKGGGGISSTAERGPDSVEKCTLQNQHKHLQRHQVGRTRAWHVSLKVFPMQRIPVEKSGLKGETLESIWEGIDYHNWNKLSSESQIPTNVGSQRDQYERANIEGNT